MRRDRRAPVVAFLVDDLALVGVEGASGGKWSNAFAFEIARDCMCGAETRIGIRLLLPKPPAGDGVCRLPFRQLDELRVEPASPHEQ
jgi:hypothetical protein